MSTGTLARVGVVTCLGNYIDMGVYEDNIVPVKIASLAEYVAERKRVSLEEALVYIYSNDMYEELYNEGAKWWYLSSEALYDEF